MGEVLYEPTCIAALQGRRVVHVGADWCHGLALCDDGALFSWGEGASCALGVAKERLSPFGEAAVFEPILVHEDEATRSRYIT